VREEAVKEPSRSCARRNATIERKRRTDTSIRNNNQHIISTTLSHTTTAPAITYKVLASSLPSSEAIELS
jgi:hypothetical protein